MCYLLKNVLSLAFVIVVAISLLAAHPVDASTSDYRILAIGDLHGDLYHAVLALYLGGASTRSGMWNMRRGTVVQMGNIFGHGEHGRLMMTMFQNYTDQAAVLGGRMIDLVGSDDVDILKDPTSECKNEEALAFGNREIRQKDLSVNGTVHLWLSRRPAVYMERETVFVHAGLLPQYAKLGVDEINRQVSEAVLRQDWEHPLLGRNGVLRTSRLVLEAQEGNCDTLERTLSILGAKRMVVGHTTMKYPYRVGVYCQKRLYAIDTRISRFAWKNGEPSGRGVLRVLEMVFPEGQDEPVVKVITVPVPESCDWTPEDDEDDIPESRCTRDETLDKPIQDTVGFFLSQTVGFTGEEPPIKFEREDKDEEEEHTEELE
eukprot:PhM_4_TR13372/c0_g1_i1/m.11019